MEGTCSTKYFRVPPKEEGYGISHSPSKIILCSVFHFRELRFLIQARNKNFFEIQLDIVYTG